MASFVLKGKTFPVSRALTKRVSWYMPAPSPRCFPPGMRVGYAIAPKEIIAKMTVCKQTEDVHTNIWAQAVANEFMCKYDYVRGSPCQNPQNL